MPNTVIHTRGMKDWPTKPPSQWMRLIILGNRYDGRPVSDAEWNELVGNQGRPSGQFLQEITSAVQFGALEDKGGRPRRTEITPWGILLREFDEFPAKEMELQVLPQLARRIREEIYPQATALKLWDKPLDGEHGIRWELDFQHKREGFGQVDERAETFDVLRAMAVAADGGHVNTVRDAIHDPRATRGRGERPERPRRPMASRSHPAVAVEPSPIRPVMAPAPPAVRATETTQKILLIELVNRVERVLAEELARLRAFIESS
jgi:hypothetical protein